MYQFARNVGLAPGTTTITLGGLDLSEEDYRSEDIRLRRDRLSLDREGARWRHIGTVVSASLTSLILVGLLYSFLRTGKVRVPDRALRGGQNA